METHGEPSKLQDSQKNRFLQVLSFTMVTFVALVCWQIAWMPWNARFFMPLVVTASAGVGYFLQSIQRRATFVQNGLILFALLQMLHGISFNSLYPLLPLHRSSIIDSVKTDSIWAKSAWGTNRYLPVGNEAAFATFFETVPKHQQLAMLPEDTVDVYHVLLLRPDLEFWMVPPEVDSTFWQGAGEQVSFALCRQTEQCADQFDETLFSKQCYAVARGPDWCLFTR